jgi:asparagine synthase (glutamine-hydrolysing)
MCGIAGFSNPGFSTPDVILKKMTGSLAHRGPDGEGAVALSALPTGDKNVFLGHRRLSIIDIDGGIQPMSYDNERY